MDENTFPHYKADVIVHFYRNEMLTGAEAKNFTKSDITPTPKPESIQRLYMRVLQLLFGFRPELHYMMPLVENVQYPSMQEGVTPIMSLYLSMCQFLPMCRVYDFQMNDLLNPKAKRTISILSGIMNFLHFRNLRHEMSSEYQQAYKADVDKLRSCEKGIKEAEQKIEKLTTIPAEQQAESRELCAALTELQSKMNHEYQEVNAINEQLAELKTELAERSQKLNQKKVEVATVKENLAKLKSQIVESPEELKNEKEKMKEQVKNTKQSKELTEERWVELQMKVQMINQHKGDLKNVYKLLQDLQCGMDKMNGQQEEIHKLENFSENRKKELKNLVTEEAQLKRALTLKMDKVSKQQIRRQKNQEMKQQHVQTLLGEYDKVHQKRDYMLNQIQEIKSDKQQIKTKIQSLRDDCKLETEKAQTIYDQLSVMLDNFHTRIEDHIHSSRDAMEKMKAHF
ncbi:kinetochore protein Nuf2 isoform X2 [Amia ocellicauda]